MVENVKRQPALSLGLSVWTGRGLSGTLAETGNRLAYPRGTRRRMPTKVRDGLTTHRCWLYSRSSHGFRGGFLGLKSDAGPLFKTLYECVALDSSSKRPVFVFPAGYILALDPRSGGSGAYRRLIHNGQSIRIEARYLVSVQDHAALQADSQESQPRPIYSYHRVNQPSLLSRVLRPLLVLTALAALVGGGALLHATGNYNTMAIPRAVGGYVQDIARNASDPNPNEGEPCSRPGQIVTDKDGNQLICR